MTDVDIDILIGEPRYGCLEGAGEYLACPPGLSRGAKHRTAQKGGLAWAEL